MTDTAKRCILWVIAREGGYVHNPNDPGGETNYGISKRAYPDIDPTKLTRENAMHIYETDYWQRIEGDALPEPVALALLDFSVNSGVARACRTLNLVCGLGAHPELSLVAVQREAEKRGAVSLACDLIQHRAIFLARLGCKRRGSEDFLAGWFRRIADNLRAVRAFEKEG